MNAKDRTGSADLPFVLVNMAITADGKIATANRAVSSFGSRRDHDHLLALRATADAVLAGARTVDSADVNLGPGAEKYRRLRLKRGLAEYNLRIVASRTASLDPQALLFTHRFSPILILAAGCAPESRLHRLRAVADEILVFGKAEVDFRKAFQHLKRHWGVNRLLCEGGGELNDALFRAGLVDELHLTVCPFVFGGRTAPTIADGSGVQALSESARLVLHSRRRIGDELFLCFRRGRR